MSGLPAGRGGVAGPAGPAKAGPLFSGLLVSFPDCRDSLRTRRMGPRKLAFALHVSVSRNHSAGGSGARRGPTGLHRHTRILIPQVAFTAAHYLLTPPPPFPHARVVFYLRWPDHF